ncbi:hypothetical protein ACNKHL_13755 [Shigella flexneri]
MLRFAFTAAEQLIAILMTLPASRRLRDGYSRGYTMSVAMTNCGHLGWTTHRQDYSSAH